MSALKPIKTAATAAAETTDEDPVLEAAINGDAEPGAATPPPEPPATAPAATPAADKPSQPRPWP